VGELTIDADLEHFHLIPKPCVTSVFWEIRDVDPDIDPRFEKEEWFSSTLLEWGRCGKLIAQEGEGLAFAQYAPATLVPRLEAFPAAAGSWVSAAYLAYCFVVEGFRGRSLVSRLVREVARDLVDRGYSAVEAIGDREWAGDSWVLPFQFLAANEFSVVREHPRFPLLRRELRDVLEPARALAEATAQAPSP